MIKKMKFGRARPQFFPSGVSAGANEDQKIAAKFTQPKPKF